MEIMTIDMISPDQVIFWQWKFITINATLIYTWLIMAILVVGSWLVTRNLSKDIRFSRWQNFLEVVVGGIRNEINEASHGCGDKYLPFIGTLFLFICLSNLLAIVPGYVAPTSSLTTTAALAVSVFFAVPIFGISSQGVGEYFKEYFRPTFIFFPFHVMGELSRTLALAVRLFGNIMSHEKVIAILLAVTPLFFPIVMQALGLLIGLIQAYIFSILAMVYIASATQAHEEKEETETNKA
ncbi:MAG: F0F1 ATP synthase subunit A [Deltaproteobacteria bacterium]|nr:F0F1 ATP synthase subunit A [Deltaproteobacteria bacterium]